MSIGIGRINWQQGLPFKFSLWNATSPQVFSAYYSQIFAADFRGSAKTVKVAQLYDSNDLTAYGAYESDKLVRVAIISLRHWGGDATRPSRNINLKTDQKSVTVRYLTSKSGTTTTDSNNIFWGGVSYTAQHPRGLQVGNEHKIVAASGGL